MHRGDPAKPLAPGGNGEALTSAFTELGDRLVGTAYHVVGNRDDDYRRQAQEDGFDVCEIAEAARAGEQGRGFAVVAAEVDRAVEQGGFEGPAQVGLVAALALALLGDEGGFIRGLHLSLLARADVLRSEYLDGVPIDGVVEGHGPEYRGSPWGLFLHLHRHDCPLPDTRRIDYSGASSTRSFSAGA